MNTETVKRAQAFRSTPEAFILLPGDSLRRIAVEPRYLDYLLMPREIFARSYTQYVSVRSQNPDLLRWLDATRQSEPMSGYPEQWNEDDFEPVAAAIDDVFRVIKWI